MKGTPHKIAVQKASDHQPDPAMAKAMSMPADQRCKRTIYHTTRIPAKTDKTSEWHDGKGIGRRYGKRG